MAGEFSHMVDRKYIGLRYVPIIGRLGESSAEWDNTKAYEPLTVVLHNGNSYTSRQFVPVGIDIANTDFWAMTGNYNAQVEQYRRETQQAYELAQGAQNDIDALLPKADFSATNTVKKYIDDASMHAINNSTMAPILFAGRLLDRFGYENRSQALFSQSVVYDNGSFYACGSYNNNTEQAIAKFDSNGNIISSNFYNQLYHANSITAIGSYLVVASGNGLNLHVINKNTLEYIRVLTFSNTEIKNIFSICADGDIIYMRCRDAEYNNYIYSTDINGSNFTLISNLGKQDASVAQGFAYKDGIAYLMNNSRNIIYVYDTESATLLNTYVLPEGDGVYPIGEPEDLFFYDDRLMLNSAEYYRTTIPMQSSMSFLFDAGITKPTNQDGNNPQSSIYTSITVDGNTSTIFKPYRNFNTVEEACIIANYLKNASITLSNLNKGNMLLYGGNYFIVGSNATVSVDSIHAYMANTVIRRIIFDTVNIQCGSVVTHDVTVKNLIAGFSKATLNNLTISDAGSIDATKCNIEYRKSVTIPENATIVRKDASSLSMVDVLVSAASKWAYKLLRSNGINRGVISIWYTGGSVGTGITVSSYISDTGFTVNVSGSTTFNTFSYDETGVVKLDDTVIDTYPIHMYCV